MDGDPGKGATDWEACFGSPAARRTSDRGTVTIAPSSKIPVLTLGISSFCGWAGSAQWWIPARPGQRRRAAVSPSDAFTSKSAGVPAERSDTDEEGDSPAIEGGRASTRAHAADQPRGRSRQ